MYQARGRQTKEKISKAVKKIKQVSNYIECKKEKGKDKNNEAFQKKNNVESLALLGRTIVRLNDEDINKTILSAIVKVKGLEKANKIKMELGLNVKKDGLELLQLLSQQDRRGNNHWEEDLGLVKETILER